MFYSHKVNRPGRSEKMFDPDSTVSKDIQHGLVVWKRPDGVPFFWDAHAGKFVTKDVFVENRRLRAEINRKKHALVPFGVMRRQRKRLEEGLPSVNLGWASL